MRLPSIAGRQPETARPEPAAAPSPLEVYENTALGAIARIDSGLSAWTQTSVPQHLVDALLDVRHSFGHLLAPGPRGGA